MQYIFCIEMPKLIFLASKNEIYIFLLKLDPDIL